MSEEVNNNSNWYEAEGIDQSFVSDKVKGFTNADGSMNVGELLKSYDASQRYIGGAVKIPQENATAEEVSAFYTKLGRPESADKYSFKPPADVNVDGVTSEHFKNFANKAFELGLSDKQLSGVMEGWVQIVDQLTADTQKARTEIAENSKKALSAPNEWGDNYQKNYDSVMGLVDKLGVKARLEMAGVLNDVAVLKAFHSIVDAGKETGLHVGSGSDSDAERIATLEKSPAYLQAGHPDHYKVVKELNALRNNG